MPFYVFKPICDYFSEISREGTVRIPAVIVAVTILRSYISKLLNQVAEKNDKENQNLNFDMDHLMMEKQNSLKSDFTKVKKNDVDIWELRLKEREQMIAQMAKYRRRSRIRDWSELLVMLGFICYMLYDTYKDGDLDSIINFIRLTF